MADTYRQVREAINEEIRPYKHLGAAATFKEDGDKVRCLIAWRGKSRVVYFMRYTTRMHAVQSIITDVRREMRALGVIVDRRQRTGTLGDVFIDAVKRHSPELVSVKPPPPPELEAEADYEDDLPDDDGPLCPDAIFDRATAAKDKPMTEIAPKASTNVSPFPPVAQVTVAAADAPKKLSHREVVAITMLLIANGKTAEIEGRPSYTFNSGWDDERVRAEVKTNAAIETVVKLRREHVGVLPSELKPKRLAMA